jgi:hypothetical protein
MVDYIEKVQYTDEIEPKYITSPCFNGGWVGKVLTLSNNVSYAASTYHKFDISSFLPNDGHDYEVLLSLFHTTGATAANELHGYVFSGANHWLTCRISSYRTCKAAGRGTCDTAVIPVRANDKYVGYYFTGSTNSFNTYFRIAAYRRIGANNWNNKNNIMNILSPDNTLLTFGGNALQGKWIKYDKTLMDNVTLPAIADGAGTMYKLDVSNIIPNDGNNYELYLSFQINTNSTDNQNGNLRIFIYGSYEVWCCQETNDAGNNKTRFCNIRIPVKHNDKFVYMKNTWASSPIYVYCQIHGYRRMTPDE